MPDDATQGQVPDDSVANSRSQDDGDSNDGDPFDKDRALATITKLRGFEKQSKQLQRELDEAKKALKAREDEKLSETERLNARLSELEKRSATADTALRQERARNAIYLAAQKHGAKKPDLVYRLLDHDALEMDDDGRPTNGEAVVKQLLKDNPELAASAGSADGGAGERGRTSAGADMNTQIRRAMGYASS